MANFGLLSRSNFDFVFFCGTISITFRGSHGFQIYASCSDSARTVQSLEAIT